MEPAQNRIPEHLAEAVFTRAARLHLQSQGHWDSYSLSELLEAGQAAAIPPEFIHQALHEIHQPPVGFKWPTLPTFLTRPRWPKVALAVTVLTLTLAGGHSLLRRPNLEPSQPKIEELLEKKQCQNCALNGADLRGKNLSGFNLQGANLRGADLTGANLSNTNLSSVDLSGAILNQANLTTANLGGAILQGTQIKAANLTGAILIASRLQASNFTGADLSYANLQNSDLEQVNFSGTNLKNTNFTEAKNLNTVDFSGAKP